MASAQVNYYVSVGGIFVSYAMYGFVQEYVFKTGYGEDKERFRNTPFILFWQSVVGSVIAKLVSKYIFNEETTTTRPYRFLPQAATSLLAMVCSNMALSFIDYPTQVLAKSCKPIPVMIFLMVFLARRYSPTKILFVLMITAGISLFMYERSVNKVKAKGTAVEMSSDDNFYGYMCLMGSLAFDGATGVLQKMVVTPEHPTSGKKVVPPSSTDLMFFSNMWNVVLLFTWLIISGEGISGISFCVRHPGIIPWIILFSTLSGVGQTFIFYVVWRFGALTTSITTTCRKFFTILLSITFHGHAVGSMQWAGILVVFAGLGLNVYNSALEKAEKPRKSPSQMI